MVIAIIAILAAILLPALNSARERGHSASCVNNLKQLSLSFMSYANDNADYYPARGSGFNGLFWAQTISRYDGNQVDAANNAWYTAMDVLFCPKTLKPLHSTAHVNYRSGYAVTQYGPTQEDRESSPEPPMKSVRIAKTSATVLVGDIAAAADTKYGFNYVNNSGYAETDSKVIGRHNNDVNYAFCDGHVQAIEKQRFIDWLKTSPLNAEFK